MMTYERALRRVYLAEATLLAAYRSGDLLAVKSGYRTAATETLATVYNIPRTEVYDDYMALNNQRDATRVL